MRQQFDVTEKRVIKGKDGKYGEVSFKYTIVIIDGKVVRIFNQVTVYPRNKNKTPFISFNSIEQNSEVFQELKQVWEAKSSTI